MDRHIYSKFWLINMLPIVDDIKNIIKKLLLTFKKTFTYPPLSLVKNNLKNKSFIYDELQFNVILYSCLAKCRKNEAQLFKRTKSGLVLSYCINYYYVDLHVHMGHGKLGALRYYGANGMSERINNNQMTFTISY